MQLLDLNGMEIIPFRTEFQCKSSKSDVENVSYIIHVNDVQLWNIELLNSCWKTRANCYEIKKN